MTLLFIHSVYNDLYLLILTFNSMPPLALGSYKSVLSVCESVL